MTQLLLVHGFAKGTNPDELLHLLQTLFDQDPIKNVWLDPWNHPRAVVEFERHFGNSKLLSYKQRKSFSLSGHQLYTEIEMPTSSVLARTNGVVTRSVQDKLSLLFTSLKHGGRKVTCVKQLGLEDWFEILFDQGWEAVLAVCNKEWILETKKLTVIPYFNCFIEPYECQYERLLRKINTHTTIDSELAAVGDLHMDDVSVLENYGLSRKQEHYKHKIINQVDACSSEAEKKGNVFSSDTKTIYMYYDLNVIPLMLSLLNFEKALKGKNFHSLVQVTFESCEVKIKGPATLVQRLHEVLTPKHYKFTRSHILKRFLALKQIQQDIKKHFENSDCHLVLEIYDDHLSLIVVDDKGNKGTFQEFMSQLVTEKTCLYLSRSDLDENKELLEYIENFNKTNSHSQIFNEDGKILLLILFYQDQLINSIAREIKKVLNEKVTIQITFQSRFYIWLLDALTFTKAAQKIFPDVSIAIDIDSQDINFNGYERQIDALKKILVDQNEKMALDCFDEMLFSDEKLLIKLKKIVEECGYHVEIIDNGNKKIVIYNKNSKVDYLEKLVGKLIMKETTYSFKNNTNLEQLAADINSKFQSFHVFAEEKKLTLFTFQGYDKGDVDKVTDFILSQNFGEFNATQHQSAHINDEVKNESEQSKISIFPCEPQRLAYCEKFLKNDIVDLQQLDESKRTLIVFGQDGIEIHYTSSQMLNSIGERLTEIIKKIIGNKFRLEFPGLKNFIDSEVGQELLNHISKNYECLIEFPEYKDQPSQESSHQFQEHVAPKTNYPRKDYNSVLLKTAKLRGLNFHWVQGDINNVNLDMRVEFVPSDECECSISTQASSKHCAHYVINLPNWRVPKGEAVQDFYRTLREGLKENVSIMFQQAAKISCYKIGISTSQLHDSKYPFPLDVIAETVVNHSLILNTDAAQGSKIFDVVICDPTNIFFSKFLYFLNERGFRISQPDEDCRRKLIRFETNVLYRDCKVPNTKKDVLDFNPRHLAFKSEHQQRYPSKERWWYYEDEGVQQSTTEDMVIIKNTIPPTQIKIWGMLEGNIHQAYLSLKSELEDKMTKTEESFKLNKAEMTLFENIKNSLINLPVKIIFTKNFVQKVKKCIHFSGKNKDKKNKLCQNCKDQTIMVVTSSSIHIQGLNKQNVNYYLQMFTDEDLVIEKKSSATGSEAELEENLLLDSTKDKYKTKGAECMEANEMSTLHLKEHSFCWMVETQGEEKDGSEASPQVTYTMIPEDLQQEVEQAYTENKGSLVKEDIIFYFGEMFVIMNKEKKGLIRSEVLNFKDRTGTPTHWTTTENGKPQCIELSKSVKEFISIEKELREKILVKIKTLQIYRVENFELYQRFKLKGEKLEGKPVRLWHQVAKEKNTKLVCKYGFYQHFSGMPSDHKNLGKGVSFSNDPRKCFTNASFQSNNKYYLFQANVMLGKSGPGKKKFLGTPEQQSAINEKGDVFMVFSDAQAYPRYLIVFTVE